MQNPQRRITTIVPPALSLLLLTGCDAGPSGPDGDPAGETAPQAAHVGESQDQALRMTGLGVLAGQDFAPGFGPPDFGRSVFGGRCSVPSDFVIRFTLTGEATHLGSYAADLEHCVQVDFTTGLNSLTDGVATFTAANGDELRDRYERLVPGSGSLGDPERHRFIGGTGRFLGASGEGWAVARCDRAAGTCDFELEGILDFDASDRGG